MDTSYKVAAVAGAVAVAEEILLAVGQIFGSVLLGKPLSFGDEITASDADLFLCFTTGIPELAKVVPIEKILGIDMIPSPKFFVTMATLQSEETRWVFCNNRISAEILVDYCSDNGLPVDRFDYVTYGDMPAPIVIDILRKAKHIIGVSSLVSPGRVLQERFGQYLQPDCDVFAVDRILTPASVAAINQWLDGRRNECLQQLKREISGNRQLQERLEYENSHDILTGFYNRRFFETVINQTDQSGTLPLAVMAIDVDNLKTINDRFGHDTGDAALKEAAIIIKESLGPDHIIARVGGDEFYALLKNTSQTQITWVIERIRGFIFKREKQNHYFPLNLSVGYAIASETYLPIRSLLKEADAAMYNDKLEHSR